VPKGLTQDAVDIKPIPHADEWEKLTLENDPMKKDSSRYRIQGLLTNLRRCQIFEQI
jgi:hypothetical protein